MFFERTQGRTEPAIGRLLERGLSNRAMMIRFAPTVEQPYRAAPRRL
jgi:hypothetical protein